MTIKEIKFKWDGQGKALSAAEIDFLLSEITRLTADLAENDAEIEKLTHERDLWENMAAMRLSDQEAIERHTRRVVAEECAEIAEAMWSDHYWAWPAMQTYADKIRKKYGVTE